MLHYNDSRRVIVNCDFCGKPLSRIQSRVNKSQHNFCNISCFGKWKSQNIYGKNSPSYKRIETKCGWCGKTIYVIPAVYNKNEKCYCNVNCMSEDYSYRFSGENSPSWKGGKCKKDQYGDTWFRNRRKTRERDNYTCQLCGITENELGQQMSVHHIRPFRNFDDFHDANKLDNLVCLCRNCHTFVHSNKNVKNVFLNDTKYLEENV